MDQLVQNGQWPARSGIAELLAKSSLTRKFASFFGPTSADDAATNQTTAITTAKASLGAQPSGNNLIRVIYRGDNLDVGKALVSAAITTFQNESVGQSNAATQAVLDFYAKQVSDAQAALSQADSDLRAFEAQHPAAPTVPRPPSEAEQLGTLQSTYNLRQSQYEAAIDAQNNAQTKAAASLTSAGNNFTIIDQPHQSPGLSLNLQRVVVVTFLGLVFGFGLGGLLIALRTWFDESARRRRSQVMPVPTETPQPNPQPLSVPVDVPQSHPQAIPVPVEMREPQAVTQTMALKEEVVRLIRSMRAAEFLLRNARNGHDREHAMETLHGLRREAEQAALRRSHPSSASPSERALSHAVDSDGAYLGSPI
jgi:hypothetical protein